MCRKTDYVMDELNNQCHEKSPLAQMKISGKRFYMREVIP
jgi:hypothetical protein